jgi:hypothetical protein
MEITWKDITVYAMLIAWKINFKFSAYFGTFNIVTWKDTTVYEMSAVWKINLCFS